MSNDKYKITFGSQKGAEFKQRLKHSPFGITINPNISTEPGTPIHNAVEMLLTRAAHELFSEEGLKRIIKFRTDGDNYDNNIKEMDESAITTEWGRGKWHIQGYIGLHHDSNIQLNIPVIREITANCLKLAPSQIHVNINTRYNNALESAAAYPLKNRA